MAKGKLIQVQVSEAEIELLAQLSPTYVVSTTQRVRWALEEFLNERRPTNGRAHESNKARTRQS